MRRARGGEYDVKFRGVVTSRKFGKLYPRVETGAMYTCRALDRVCVDVGQNARARIASQPKQSAPRFRLLCPKRERFHNNDLLPTRIVLRRKNGAASAHPQEFDRELASSAAQGAGRRCPGRSKCACRRLPLLQLVHESRNGRLLRRPAGAGHVTFGAVVSLRCARGGWPRRF